jgi:hypothetical protein
MLTDDDENTDTDETIIEGSPNFESTRASQFPFDEASIDNISASLSNLQITGTPITPATAISRTRPTTRATLDLPPSDSKEIILPELPDQRRRRLQAVDDTYESQADLVLENLPQIIIQEAEAEMNPDESAFAESADPVEDYITALVSELRIPAQLVDRFRDFRLPDLVRLNQTTQENRPFEISRI